MAVKNYLKVFSDGHTEATKFRPLFQEGERERAYAGENPDVLVNGLWWNSTNGDEKVVNGNFNDGTTGWTASANTSLSVELGSLKILNTAVEFGEASTTFNTIVGKKHRLSFYCSAFPTKFLYRLKDTATGTIVYDSGWKTSTGEYVVEFTAQYTQYDFAFVNGYTSGGFSKIDNVTCFETEIIPDTVYPTQFTYASQDDKLASFLIEDNQPVDITFDDDSPSIVQNVIQAKDMVVARDVSVANDLKVDSILKINNTEWLNNGVDYDDPDAIGANPVAKIYPDGTIVGSTDNGDYTKYPNGDISMFYATEYLTSFVASGGIYYDVSIGNKNYPIALLSSNYSSLSVEEAPRWGSIGDSSLTQWVLPVVYSSTGGNFTAALKFIAKGRWK